MNLVEDGRTVVWLHGEHDISTATELGDELLTASMADKRDVVLDLSGLTFMDASTVGVIVHLRQVLRAQSRKLALRSPTAFTRHVLDLCGILGFLENDQVVAEQITGALALNSWVEVPLVSPDATHSAGAPPIEAIPDHVASRTR